MVDIFRAVVVGDIMGDWRKIKVKRVVEDRNVYEVTDEAVFREVLFQHVKLPDERFRNEIVKMITQGDWKKAIGRLCEFYGIKKPVLPITYEEGAELYGMDEKSFELYAKHLKLPPDMFRRSIERGLRVLEFCRAAAIPRTKMNNIMIKDKYTTDVKLVLHEFFHILDWIKDITPKKAAYHHFPEYAANAYANAFVGEAPGKLKVLIPVLL